MAQHPDLDHRKTVAPLAGPRLDALLLEFLVCAMAGAIATFGTLGRATVFAAAARACGAYGAAGERGHPISVNALAASLARPFETTRRNANMLIASGWLARNEAGLYVPALALEDSVLLGFATLCHDLLTRLIGDLDAAALALPLPRADIRYHSGTGIGLAFDLLLAGFESREDGEHGLLATALLTTIAWANLRGAGAAADGKAPVKPSTVARTLGLPYATVARNLDVLRCAGVLERRADGLVIVSSGTTAAPAAPTPALANRARQLIGRAAQAGFPMQTPSRAYIGDRPALPALG